MIATRELDGLEFLWDAGLGDRFGVYQQATPLEPIALAAALVETALAEQQLGCGVAVPPALLVADLCLARASRLLAESAGQDTQIGFARAVEQVSAAAAEGRAVAVRPLLLETIGSVR